MERKMEQSRFDTPAPRVGLFITCLADIFRPSIGFSTVKLLRAAGCRVEVPRGQTCCGQPAYNGGDNRNARALARQVVSRFEGYDYVVLPSGSCAGMLKRHYPVLFAEDPVWASRMQRFAERCFEVTGFLVDVCGVGADIGAKAGIGLGDGDMEMIDPSSDYGVVTYHDSCSGLRELGIHAQPRRLLERRGIEVREMAHLTKCCGFGGAFCMEYPALSVHMVSNKIAKLEKTGADTLLGGDLGCLLNIAGQLKRKGSPIRVYHVVEALAGIAGLSAIAQGTEDR
nr:MAG: L-lactate dehydrogenase complex protein LldE [Candidatus Kentron sp. MB]VFK77282.1 MAG: L-lactate dehydrogenase complex protein LldE [Candidatus Kentron sp. MB]